MPFKGTKWKVYCSFEATSLNPFERRLLAVTWVLINHGIPQSVITIKKRIFVKRERGRAGETRHNHRLSLSAGTPRLLTHPSIIQQFQLMIYLLSRPSLIPYSLVLKRWHDVKPDSESSSSLPSRVTSRESKGSESAKAWDWAWSFCNGTHKMPAVKIIMSTETSASETTPLRRSENETPDHKELAQSNSNSRQTTVNSNNNNYSNSVQVRLQEQDRDSDSEQQQHTATITMDTNKRILCRVGLDVLILLCGKYKNSTNQTNLATTPVYLQTQCEILIASCYVFTLHAVFIFCRNVYYFFCVLPSRSLLPLDLCNCKSFLALSLSCPRSSH